MAALSLKDVQNLKIRGRLLHHIENNIPGFKIVRKSKSDLMGFLSMLLFFNRHFLTKYVTTIYPRVYVPDSWGRSKRGHQVELSVLAHEYVHLYDRKRLGWLFNILYLSPQIFALGTLGAFWNVWWLLCLFFLLPLPSPGRAWLEFRGYRMNLAIFYWTNKRECGINWIVKEFTSSNYYFMMPFGKYIRKKFEKAFEDIKRNKLTPELMEVKSVLFKDEEETGK